MDQHVVPLAVIIRSGNYTSGSQIVDHRVDTLAQPVAPSHGPPICVALACQCLSWLIGEVRTTDVIPCKLRQSKNDSKRSWLDFGRNWKCLPAIRPRHWAEARTIPPQLVFVAKRSSPAYTASACMKNRLDAWARRECSASYPAIARVLPAIGWPAISTQPGDDNISISSLISISTSRGSSTVSETTSRTAAPKRPRRR